MKDCGDFMLEITQNRFCEHCQKETLHQIREDATEIEYRCTVCNSEENQIKSFF